MARFTVRAVAALATVRAADAWILDLTSHWRIAAALTVAAAVALVGRPRMSRPTVPA